MSDNNSSIIESINQVSGSSEATGVLNPVELIRKLLSLRDTSQNTASLIQAFLDYLVSQPDVIQASYYSLDPKNRDIRLNYLSTRSSDENEIPGIVIPARSTETIARVAFNAQPFVVADLGTENVSYQNAILDKRTRSIFISPVLKINQVISIVEIQCERPSGFSQKDLPGLSLSVQLFGDFIEEKSLVDSAGLSFSDLANYAFVTRQVIGSDDPESINRILLSAFKETDLIAFIFGVQENNLTIEDLYDSKGTGFDASLVGLQVEVVDIQDKLSGSETQFFNDLPAVTDLGDLFSFFIRRECLSLAVIPIFLGSSLNKLLIIGSRDTVPLNQTRIHVFQSIIEIFQDRIAFDSRAQLSSNLEKDLQFLFESSGVISQNLDHQTFYISLLQAIRNNYGENISLSIIKLNPEKSSLIISKFDSNKSPDVIERSTTVEEINFLEELNKPLIYRETDPAILEKFTIFEPKSDFVLIPIISDAQNIDLLFLATNGDKRSLQNISPFAFNNLGRIVSAFFVQRNLRVALSRLDETVTKTVNRQQILNQVSIGASSGRSQNEILGMIPSRLVELSLCDQACVLIPGPSGNLEIRHSHSFSEDQIGQILAPGERLAGQTASSNQTSIFSSETADGSDELINPANRSGLAAPISFGNEVYAILEIEHSQPGQYSEYDRELLQIFSLNIGSLLANLRLIDQVRAQVNQQEKLFEVTNKLRRTLDMGSILQISADEIARITKANKATIQIKISEDQFPDLDSDSNGGDE